MTDKDAHSPADSLLGRFFGQPGLTDARARRRSPPARHGRPRRRRQAAPKGHVPALCLRTGRAPMPGSSRPVNHPSAVTGRGRRPPTENTLAVAAGAGHHVSVTPGETVEIVSSGAAMTPLNGGKRHYLPSPEWLASWSATSSQPSWRAAGRRKRPPSRLQDFICARPRRSRRRHAELNKAKAWRRPISRGIIVPRGTPGTVPSTYQVRHACPPTLAALPSATARSAESGRQDDRIRSRTRQPLTSGAGHTRPRHNYCSGAPSTASQPTGLARITAALGAGALGRGATLHSQAGDRHRWLQGFLHGPDCGGWRWLRLRCSSRQ